MPKNVYPFDLHFLMVSMMKPVHTPSYPSPDLLVIRAPGPYRR